MSNLFMASSHPRLHCVPKNDTALAWYIVNVHRPILIIFGWNIAKKVSPRMAHFFHRSASALPEKTESRKLRLFLIGVLGGGGLQYAEWSR